MTLLLVGCGKMGGAMLKGWLAAGRTDILVVDPVAQGLDVPTVASFDQVPADLQAQTVVLAVKPQMMDQVIPAAARHLAPGGMAVSIAAGKTLGYFARWLGAAACVRAMPNLPAAIGRGITVAVPNSAVTLEQRADADALLAACGAVEWVDDEALIDPVTAVSGGGPAYVFLLVETLAKAGVASGLPADLAERLARATVAGSGALLDADANSAAQLRQNVSSPGGTTLQALAVLMAEDGVQPLYDRAIAAASRRAGELATS
ncbi:MAG: pyrroline-5-carboxylate reductase [Alphaproteobacteria bacterium]|nr:pyrroline-5-carboxylate reductase [Alphaproteobacteria bacterium]